jgi:hypothetical protein
VWGLCPYILKTHHDIWSASKPDAWSCRLLQKEHTIARQFNKGDKVSWETSQGRTDGTIQRKLTQPTDIKGHHVAASKGNPEYLVKSDKSGDLAAHKPEALKKH